MTQDYCAYEVGAAFDESRITGFSEREMQIGDPLADALKTMRERAQASKTQVAGAHYRDMAIQPSEYIHRNTLGWCEGNVVKYVTRHRFKNGAEDIKKAIHYLELLLEWEYGISRF